MKGRLLSLIAVTAILSACSTTSATQKQLNHTYMQGYNNGIQHEKTALSHSDIVKKVVPAKIVGGVYIPQHTEYVYSKQITNNKVPLNSKKPTDARSSLHSNSTNKLNSSHAAISKNTPRIPLPETVEESVATVKPTPLPDPNKQARLFEDLVNNYNFNEASNLYRNVITYVDVSKIQDKYSYYSALGKYLLVKHDYKNAYDAYQKAYFNASDVEEQLQSLENTVTAAKLTGNKDLEFTALLNLGDFKLIQKDKLGALKCYYKALKIKTTPSVNLRIANILQNMGREQLAKAFALKAYILGRK